LHELSLDFPASSLVIEAFFVDNSFQKIGNRAMLAHLRLAMPLSVAAGRRKRWNRLMRGLGAILWSWMTKAT
jgi:hypothetical protein